jgi:hypothetical protein
MLIAGLFRFAPSEFFMADTSAREPVSAALN